MEIAAIIAIILVPAFLIGIVVAINIQYKNRNK